MITYKKYMDMMLKKHVNAIICHSKAGYGKTYETIAFFKDKGIEHTYISGVTTAVELYKILCDNNNKILIIDDIETLFNDDRIINILKSALWNAGEHRVVSYKTTHKSLENYPDSLIYEGQIIILANEINAKKDKSFYALMSRCLVYELKYTTKQLTEKSLKIIEQDKTLKYYEKEHIQKMIRKYNIIGYEYNLRTLCRMIEFVKYDIANSEELYSQSIQKNDIALTVKNIIDNEPKNEQIQKFKEQTGKSMATFYRIKKELEE